MLIAKGYEVGFHLEDGEKILAPSSYALLHDPSGRESWLRKLLYGPSKAMWDYESVLVAPFKRTNEDVEDDLAEEYFGYLPKAGEIDVPPRTLSEWTKVGSVKEIDYWRPGVHKGDWWHPFSEGGWFFKTPLPVLYRRGRLLRLELPAGAELNHRGFVWP